MLEVVFGASIAGAMKVALGYRGCVDGAASIIISQSDGSVASRSEKDKLWHEAEECERLGWENAVQLEGSQRNIINLSLALSVGDIDETGIGAGRESALSLLMGTFPDMASQVVNELLETARKGYVTILERMQTGESIRVWASNQPDEMCGLHWLMEQLRPVGLEKLDVTLVKLPDWEERSDGCIVQYNGWGDVEPYHLGRMALHGKSLPTNYICCLANRWKKLQQENAPLRAVVKGRLVSVPESLYDTFILREIATQKDEFMEAQLVGQVLGKYQMGIGDGWIAQRIEQFIRDGLLTPVTHAKPNDPIYHRILRKNRK